MLTPRTFVTVASLLSAVLVQGQVQEISYTATVTASPFTDTLPTTIQNPPSIIGYDSVATQSGLRTWYGERWTTKGSVAGPCPTDGACNLVTGCSDGNLVYENGTTAACGSPLETGCKTLNIFDSPPSNGQRIQRFACFMGWPSTIYRQEFAVRATIVQATRSGFVVPSSVTYPAVYTGGPGNWYGDYNQGPRITRAEIAGAVVGGIAGLVLLIGGLVFFLRRRKSRQTNQNSGHVEETYAPPTQEVRSVAQPYYHEAAEVGDGHPPKAGEVLPPYTEPKVPADIATKEKKDKSYGSI